MVITSTIRCLNYTIDTFNHQINRRAVKPLSLLPSPHVLPVGYTSIGMVMMMVLVLIPVVLSLILFCLWCVPTGNWISDYKNGLLRGFGVILIIAIVVGFILVIMFNKPSECFDDMGYPCIEEEIGPHPRTHQYY